MSIVGFMMLLRALNTSDNIGKSDGHETTVYHCSPSRSLNCNIAFWKAYPMVKTLPSEMKATKNIGRL